MGTGKKIFHLSLFIALAWIGCVKDPQDIPSGLTIDPAFHLSGSFDGQSLDIEAGRGGWTNQPVVIEEDSTLVYSSIFSLNECLDQCKPSWEFRFYNALPSTGNGEDDFFQTIDPGDKEFVLSNQQRDSFEITLNAHPSLFLSGYSYWENLNVPITTFQSEFNDVVGYGEYLNVCFQSLAYTGCQYNQCIYFDPSTYVPCQSSIVPKIEDPRTISLMVRPEGTAPFKIEWFNGSTSSSIVLPLQDTDVEIYASVTVTDALGNRSELNQSIRVQDGVVDACTFPISLKSVLRPSTAASDFADRVEIIYTDENDVAWKSISGIQPLSSFLTISDVEYFGLSPMNQAAYKISLLLSVELFNQFTGEAKHLETALSNIALSHP